MSHDWITAITGLKNNKVIKLFSEIQDPDPRMYFIIAGSRESPILAVLTPIRDFILTNIRVSSGKNCDSRKLGCDIYLQVKIFKIDSIYY